MLRRDCLKLAGLALPALPARPAAGAATFPTTIAPSATLAFRTPGKNPNGLQATSEGLWVLDQGTNRVALLRYSDGGVIREFATETDRGSGITFDGSALWIASTYNSRLVKLDAQTGKTIKEYRCPGSGVVKWGPRGAHPHPTGAHGMEWKYRQLWVAVPPAATIYVIDPEGGGVIRSFPAPGVRPHGIGWDADGSLWCTESIHRSFFKLDPKTGQILRQVMLPLTAPEVDGLVIEPHGMSIWEGKFWFSCAETGEVYNLPIPS
ncbi:MAG TPA: hypothetical protein VG672_02330 [Bryobacteraceae bacterium]|jgi:streptogramin lyase|nr:hypothetical protein [Bryobacteraceae bacterium]